MSPVFLSTLPKQSSVLVSRMSPECSRATALNVATSFRRRKQVLHVVVGSGVVNDVLRQRRTGE